MPNSWAVSISHWRISRSERACGSGGADAAREAAVARRRSGSSRWSRPDAMARLRRSSSGWGAPARWGGNQPSSRRRAVKPAPRWRYAPGWKWRQGDPTGAPRPRERAGNPGDREHDHPWPGRRGRDRSHVQKSQIPQLAG